MFITTGDFYEEDASKTTFLRREDLYLKTVGQLTWKFVDFPTLNFHAIRRAVVEMDTVPVDVTVTAISFTKWIL